MTFSFLQVDQTHAWEKVHDGEILGGNLGVVVVVGLFILERTFSFFEKKKEAKRNWYYSVVVLPNLKTINDFFKNYVTLAISASIEVAKTITPAQGDVSSDVKSVFFNKLLNLIQDLELEFLMIVYTYELKRHNALSQILLDMHDEVVNEIDTSSYDINLPRAIGIIAKNKKSLFFDQLYQGLK